MIANNGSAVLILLALTLGMLSFQLWRNSLLRIQLRLSKVRIDHEEFSVISTIIEQERSRISSELHDELGTLLSIIYLDLELVTHEASSLSPDGENRLNEIKRNLNMVIESIRTNIWNLSTQMFDQVDLGFVIRELCHKLDRHKGTYVAFMQSGLPFALTEKHKLNLFRITQELLTNSIKHSSAWNISVHIHWENDQSLSITLEDDGVSYSERKIREGMGIINIARRASFINAELTRESLKKGHRIILSVKLV
jgi:signal transduction histidine kinase